MCNNVALAMPDGVSDLPRPSADFQTVKSSRLFAGVAPGEYANIFGSARAKTFVRGEMLYFKNDPVRQVILLTIGTVKITQFGAGGSEVILGLRVPGEVLGVTEVMLASKHTTTAQAFRLCRALIWEARMFKTLLEHSPVLHQNMTLILRDDIVELEARFQEVATEKVSARVARQLLRLREKVGHIVQGGVEVSMSRQELAQMTGTTLFTVSRLLSGWEAQGIVRASREAVTVCDILTLRSVADPMQDVLGKIG